LGADIKSAFVRLSGGLGNQLFQLGAGLYAVRQFPNARICLDTRFLGKYETVRDFEIDFVVKHLPAVGIAEAPMGLAGYASQLRLGRLLDTALVGCACIGTTERLKQFQGESCSWLVLDGYFQHPDLALPSLDRQNLFAKLYAEYSHLLRLVSSPSGIPRVAIHIRRGDFVSSKAASSVFKTVQLDYYRAAVQRFSENTLFVVFGDDPVITSEFSKEINGVDVPKLGLSLKEDFMLMAMCDHHIIANSTFSWWAAHLGNSDGKRIISPRNWYVDVERSKTNPLLMPNFELLDV
jgi:Glycosyl transferase family 11